MERTSEFLGFVAKAQLTSRQPEGTDARTTRDQFTEAARGIVSVVLQTSLSHFLWLCCRFIRLLQTDGISRTNRITAALRAGAPSSADAREHEQMVVVFTARCVKELATLESRVSGEEFLRRYTLASLKSRPLTVQLGSARSRCWHTEKASLRCYMRCEFAP